MRERLGGELLWMPSMVLSGVDGILLILLGHVGWDFEGILVGGGGCFLAILNSIQVMGLRSDFGIMYGAEG
jgi:hypothetical protein